MKGGSTMITVIMMIEMMGKKTRQGVLVRSRDQLPAAPTGLFDSH